MANKTRRGEHWVWVSGAALAVALLITGLLMCVVLRAGLSHFWPKALEKVVLEDGRILMGEVSGRDRDPSTNEPRTQYKIGNGDWYPFDYQWVDASEVTEKSHPRDAVALERREHGRFFGFVESVTGGSVLDLASTEPWDRLQEALEGVRDRRVEVTKLEAELRAFDRKARKLRDAIRKVKYKGVEGRETKLESLETRNAEVMVELEEVLARSTKLEAELRSVVASFRDADGRSGEIVIDDIVRAFRPNRMSSGEKWTLYGSRIKELLFENPRESNTEGGLFPAIFGTVFMVFLMSIFCVPLGVLAAVYLHEYANKGLLVRCVRIAVNNLAGVPSIVYGIFGLGFLVYGVGSTIDEIFFAHRLPEATFGTGGILWASLALALLTVPVVIVSTEEALSAIPRGVREGSLGLGATKLQTLIRVILPMASPGILTGFVLAMARAAGEVAPLMLLGAVKHAPKLPIDAEFPFVHFERKFMHLGYHIYDVGFQSPNIEAVRPMVYVTTMLLLLIVVFMSLFAILLRNRMRRRYTTGSF